MAAVSEPTEDQRDIVDAHDLVDTGERMLPEVHRGLLIHAEHVNRYRALREIVAGKFVLDIASGAGYGSAMLAETAADVVGVDADPSAVAHAARRYAGPRTRFLHGSAEKIPLEDQSVDVVVTFETIEHIDDYRAFLREVRRVLRPGGIAVVSTPNDPEFTPGNHFHLHQFTRHELLAELGEVFPFLEEYLQATWKYVAVARPDRLAGVEADWNNDITAPLDPARALYFFVLCSAVPISVEVEPIGVLGEHYSERALVEGAVQNESEKQGLRDQLARESAERARLESEISALRGTLSWRVTSPLRWIRRRLG